MAILWTVGGFLIVLVPIIFVHELGHFGAARLSNIRVEEFGIGFPPRIMKLTERKGTVYTLNWIPLGGFVRPAGEDDPSVPGGLAAASKRARFFVLSAGAVANFIMALVVFWITFMIGPPLFDESRVAILDVFSQSPAAEAHLQKNDIIVAINDITVGGDIDLVQNQVDLAGTNPVEMLIDRGGQEVRTSLTPRINEEMQKLMIGIQLGYLPTGARASLGPVDSAVQSVRFVGDYVALVLRVPAMLVRGEMSASEARPISVVGISQIAGRAAETSASSGNLYPLLNMIAFVNVALGLANLLPLPALDGGRIMFVLLEAVRGRRIEPEREGMVHIIGMLVLLGLMALMIVQDIVNPIIPF